MFQIIILAQVIWLRHVSYDAQLYNLVDKGYNLFLDLVSTESIYWWPANVVVTLLHKYWHSFWPSLQWCLILTSRILHLLLMLLFFGLDSNKIGIQKLKRNKLSILYLKAKYVKLNVQKQRNDSQKWGELIIWLKTVQNILCRFPSDTNKNWNSLCSWHILTLYH